MGGCRGGGRRPRGVGKGCYARLRLPSLLAPPNVHVSLLGCRCVRALDKLGRQPQNRPLHIRVVQTSLEAATGECGEGAGSKCGA